MHQPAVLLDLALGPPRWYPAGRAGDRTTKAARVAAHDTVFLAFCQAETYRWLQHAMKLPEAEAHVGLLQHRFV